MMGNARSLLTRSAASKSAEIDTTTLPDMDMSREGFSYDPSSKPPAFGHPMLKYFGFDKDYVNVNHGTL